MASLTIVGAGGHGKDIAAICQHAYPSAAIVFLDDDESLGFMPTALQIMADWYLLGFNSPRLREGFDRQDHSATYAIHPHATVGPGVRINAGTVLAPGVRLLTDVTLGRHVHFGYNSSATRTVVGDYTTISPGVTICGDVQIGRRCHIGAGATICNLVAIGDDVTVGAGAVVLPNTCIADGQTVVGVPAKARVRA